MAEEPNEITCLLRAWSQGDGAAQESLWPLVYDELRRMARGYLAGERKGHTLQPTALVHEAYLRLVDQREARFQDRNHFFAIAARIMRRILVDHARQRRCAKRGGDEIRLSLDEAAEPGAQPEPDVVAVDDALVGLEAMDPFKASVVELRFFAGFSNAEAGEVLGCSEKTVQRHWGTAKIWLLKELRQAGAHGT